MKVTVITYLHCENHEPNVLGVIEGASKVKIKKLVLEKLSSEDTKTRLVETSGFNGDLVVEQRFRDDGYEDGFCDWMDEGTVYLSTQKTV